MPEREPSWIERLTQAYWDRRTVRLRWVEMSYTERAEHCKDMLAAVKVLQKIARDDPRGRTREIAWLDGIIAEHERPQVER